MWANAQGWVGVLEWRDATGFSGEGFSEEAPEQGKLTG